MSRSPTPLMSVRVNAGFPTAAEVVPDLDCNYFTLINAENGLTMAGPRLLDAMAKKYKLASPSGRRKLMRAALVTRISRLEQQRRAYAKQLRDMG